MRSAIYFVAPARHLFQANGRSGREQQSQKENREFSPLGSTETLGLKAVRILVVGGLHLGLFGWLAQTDAARREVQSPVRLDVRTIAVPAAGFAGQASIPIATRPEPQIRRKAVPPARPAASQEQSMPAETSTLHKPLQESVSMNAKVPVFSGMEHNGHESATSARNTQQDAAVAPSAVSGAGAAASAARFDADYLKNPAPDYPSGSRRMREEGTVYLDVNVTAEGKAGDLRIRKSSGYVRLDEAALDTVRQWRFIPARRGTEAVSAHVVVPVVFRLGG